MPVHDWARVDTWQFHHFHTLWLAHLAEYLNTGGLPVGYEAYAEQRAELYIPDVLTLTGAVPPDGGSTGPVAVGRPLPAAPLSLDGGVFVDLPLEETYMTGYDRLPAVLKAELG